MSKLLGSTLALLGLALLAVSFESAAAKEATKEAAKEGAKSASRPYLGLAVKPTPQGAEPAGLIVGGVTPDGPAAKARIRVGDVLVKVGDKEVKDYEALMNSVASHKPGDKLTFHVMRDGKDQAVEVTLAERPGRLGAAERLPREKSAFLGVRTEPLSPAVKKKLGLKEDEGVVVADVAPDSPAAKAGIKDGDVLTHLGGQTISDPRELREAIQKAGIGKKVAVGVVRGEEKKEFTVQLQEQPVGGGGSFPQFPRPGLGRPAMPPEAAERIRELEKKVQELEKRLREAEQKPK